MLMWSRFAFLVTLAVAGLFFTECVALFHAGIREGWPYVVAMFIFLFLAARNWEYIDRNRRPPT